jgi:hypothetical protein
MRAADISFKAYQSTEAGGVPIKVDPAAWNA